MRVSYRLLQLTAMKRKTARGKSNGASKLEKGGNVRSKEQDIQAGGVDEDVDFHSFLREEVSGVQTQLLEWYDANKRDLPWRHQSSVADINQRAYRVWVSEIMCQQTQVATVIDYYNRWMKKWPNLQDLSQAKLEEVNEMWSGLGYYSRGKRLHEGAQKVVSELHGEMPKSCEELQKQLPGVGRYTAGAIASISFGQKTGVVDGNVIRVLSRLRMIGADSSAQTTMDKFWSLANRLAECERPGDLNQSLMELGATVCTPKAPRCSSCPLSQVCKSYTKVKHNKKLNTSHLLLSEGISEVPDIECLAEECQMCPPADEPWDTSLGVQNFPRKAKKKAAREQTSTVCVVCKVCKGGQRSFLIMQRPEKGLLAGLWEFPSSDIDTSSQCSASVDLLEQLDTEHGVHIDHVAQQAHLGEVVHIFSHIHQTYQVSMVSAAESDVTVTTERPSRWLTQEELDTAALSTAMRKVFKLYCDGKANSKSLKRKRNESREDRKQRPIDSFFKPKS